MMKKRGQYARLAGFGYAHNTERGMTLIEVLTAMGILAAVGVVFLVAMSTSTKAVIVSQEQISGESLAKSELEYVKSVAYQNAHWSYDLPSNHPYWDATHSLPDGYSGYTVKVNAAQMEVNPDNPPGEDDGLQKITVTITRGQKTVFTLEGYKCNIGQ